MESSAQVDSRACAADKALVGQATDASGAELSGAASPSPEALGDGAGRGAVRCGAGRCSGVRWRGVEGESHHWQTLFGCFSQLPSCLPRSLFSLRPSSSQSSGSQSCRQSVGPSFHAPEQERRTFYISLWEEKKLGACYKPHRRGWGRVREKEESENGLSTRSRNVV